METKKQVTTKFIIGAVLIAVSLALGKLALIPIVIFPGNKSWQVAMFWTYIFSWIILIPGLYLAGKEGWLMVTHKYKEYSDNTINKMRGHGKKAAQMTDDTLSIITEPVKKAKGSSILQKKKR
jgi:hypothetical protein